METTLTILQNMPSKSRRCSTKRWIEKAMKVHGDLYDYTISEYTHSMDKIKIICKKHGIFEQTAAEHLRYGCKLCGRETIGISGKKTRLSRYGDENYHNVEKAKETAEKNNSYIKGAEKRKERCMKAHGVESHTQLPEWKENAEARCMARYGVRHHMHVPEIANRVLRSKYRDYKFPTGEIVKIQGFENKALDILIRFGYSYDDIEVGCSNTPTIRYTFENKPSRYYPDIFLKFENRLIEVKSEYTFNLHKDKNEAKRLASIDAGYNFEFWIF